MREKVGVVPQVLAGGVVLLAVALSGCAGPRPATETTAAPSSSAATARSRASALPHEKAANASVAPVGASALAVRAMTRFCRPALTARRWIDGLDPLLTLSAAEVYASVNPARVTCTRVTGIAHLGSWDDWTCLVAVPTDGGRFQVTLTRAALPAPWLVFRATPAALR